VYGGQKIWKSGQGLALRITLILRLDEGKSRFYGERVR
jgi:hypothetical protein